MSTVSNQTYYEILEISSTATDDEIRKAYKSMAAKCHPDRARQNNLTNEKATELFKLVGKAYATVSDPQKRRMYDISLIPKSHLKTNHTPTPLHSNFFQKDSDFRPSPSRPNSLRKESDLKFDFHTWIIPDELDKETIHIIDSDDIVLLGQYIDEKILEASYLKTMLYVACKKGKLNTAKYLIEDKKLSPHLGVNKGPGLSGRIFGFAAESGNLSLVKYLLEEQHVDIESRSDDATALSRAASKGHTEVVRYLISKGANVNPPHVLGGLALNKAISSRSLSVVVLLIDAGSQFGHFTLARAIECGDLSIVQYLLHIKPGLRNHNFATPPACTAVSSGNVALVKYLEKKESLDILSWDSNYSVALLLNAGAESGSKEMMQFLLYEKRLLSVLVTNPQYIEEVLKKAVKHDVCPTEKQIKERIKLVQFLLEEIQLTVPKTKLLHIKEDSAEFSGIEMNCYLQSHLTDSEPIKAKLKNIATQGLLSLYFADLFQLYKSKLITKGKNGDFSTELRNHIEKRGASLEQLEELFTEKKDGETAKET